MTMEANLLKQNYDLKKENESLKKEIVALKKENKTLKEELTKTRNALSFANNRIRQLEAKIEKDKLDEEERINAIVTKAVEKVTQELNKIHEKEVNELKDKISRLEKRLNTDSSNSGIPTSKDPIGKHKIQNNREKSNKSIGAQVGHEIHKLKYFKDDEITETIEHKLDRCPNCGGDLIETNVVISDIIDIEIKVTKTRNNIHNYKCSNCRKKLTANDILPRGVSYGENINSISLSLMNEANTPLNKITSFFTGITNSEVSPTEGYLVKLQKKSAKGLKQFTHDLKEKIISLDCVNWDDTVVIYGIGKSEEGYDEDDLAYLKKLEEKQNDDENKTIKKHRQGIIRFYGNDDWAYLVGHRYKDEKGIDEDVILENLSENCIVMHDHVLLNYNDKFSFKNAECNQHALRGLKANIDMFPDHLWAAQMRTLLINTNNEKKALLEEKITCFSDNKLKEIFDEYDRIISLGFNENNMVDLTYVSNKHEEFKLLNRLKNFKINHLMFATDFICNFTNNTAERGLRLVKRKIAISFMFKNVNRMKDYATILSYLETCFRHGISRYEASKRLAVGNPFTVKELEKLDEKEKNEN